MCGYLVPLACELRSWCDHQCHPGPGARLGLCSPFTCTALCCSCKALPRVAPLTQALAYTHTNTHTICVTQIHTLCMLSHHSSLPGKHHCASCFLDSTKLLKPPLHTSVQGATGGHLLPQTGKYRHSAAHALWVSACSRHKGHTNFVPGKRG